MAGENAEAADSTMLLLALMGQQLVSRDTAVEVAKLLLKANYGSEELDLQLPLSVTDQTGHWLIRGSKRRNIGAKHPANDVREADFVLAISKFDCQVLKLAFEGGLTPLDSQGRPLE